MPYNEDDPRERELPDQSEDALAARFVAEHKGRIVYTPSMHRWRLWSEGFWKDDDTEYVRNEVRIFLREFANERIVAYRAGARRSGDDATPAEVYRSALKHVEKFKTLRLREAILRIVESDPRMTVSADIWDGPSCKMLLNTPQGTVDLRTGQSMKARPSDYITKSTSVSPSIMPTPLWDSFLHRIMAGEQNLISYLQRVLGYCLTGDTSEQSFFFAYGTGANGKSVLMATIEGIIQDYHQRARIETFISSYKDLHPTYVATLQGARFVTSTETEEGRKWNQARIQEMTGGDQIRAHFMRQDSFSFTPQFKIFIAGNHKPSMQSVGEAIHRRLHLIPFTVTIPREERDKQLVEKLREEWPGILRWMIDGCVQWVREGLRPTASVVAATDEYVADEDSITAWYYERCRADENHRESSAGLYADWAAWSKANGLSSGTIKSFSQRLNERAVVFNLTKHRLNSGWIFKGIRLIGEPEDLIRYNRNKGNGGARNHAADHH